MTQIQTQTQTQVHIEKPTQSQIIQRVDIYDTAGVKPISNPTPTPKPKSRYFGNIGTISIVSVITSAIKSIIQPNPNPNPNLNDHTNMLPIGAHNNVTDDNNIILTGYNGVMFPVMEDRILALRASNNNTNTNNNNNNNNLSTFNIRDLILFSTIW